MTIAEINHKLKNMSKGSKSHFFRYMASIKVFEDKTTARNTFEYYLICKPKVSTFIKRQEISDAFEKWRYKYGGSIKSACRLEIIDDYNHKLRKIWGLPRERAIY